MRSIVMGAFFVCAVCYVAYQCTKRSRTSKVPSAAIVVGVIAFAVAGIAGIVSAVIREGDDSRAVRTYLRQQGYHVVDLDHKQEPVKNGAFYWSADVYRMADPSCGGTIKLRRSNDRTIIVSDLTC
ncbi:MAG TPA: hypothetical protein VJM32_02470 [Candidatus Saccharimonadales bacterium]|nr:hypothetical protein [Candidatus Saccharimonadales bacterium]